MGDHNAGRSCCAARCSDGGYCSLPERHGGECYSDKELLLDFKYPARHELAAKDAEIAALKAEVERLRESEADLIQWIFDGGQRAGIEPADLSPTEVLTRMSDDLAAHKRALAAGPAALHYRSCDCCSIVEAAQAEAMKEDGDGK